MTRMSHTSDSFATARPEKNSAVPAKYSIPFSHSLKVLSCALVGLTRASELWIQWLDDEEGAAADDETVLSVYHLYHRAVSDYLCMHCLNNGCSRSSQQLGSGLDI